MSKKNISTLIQLIVFLSFGLGLIIWRYNAMEDSDKIAMFQSFKNVRWIWVLPIVIISFLSHYFRALRWKLLLQSIKPSTNIVNTTFAVLVGYLANTLIPRLGEVAKCTVLAKYEGVPVDKLVGTVIAERAFDMACFFILIGLTLILQFDIIAPFAHDIYQAIFFDTHQEFLWSRILLLFSAAVVGIFLFILIYKKIKVSKAGKIIQGIIEGLKTIGKVNSKFQFILYTLLIWMMYMLVSVFVFYAMPETQHISPLAGLSVITFGSIAMMLTPGGIGAFPVIISQVLLLYGISEGVGQAYGWINWALQTIIVIVLGLFSLTFIPIYNRNKQYEQKKYNSCQNP
jgi:uncharacterized protein (TIRG00374 family)